MALPFQRAPGAEASKTTAPRCQPAGSVVAPGSFQFTRCVVYMVMLLFVLCAFCQPASCVPVRWRAGERATLEGLQKGTTEVPAFAEAGQAPAPVDAEGTGQTWYTLRTNQAPRLLRVTAMQEDKLQQGSRWYQIMFNFKPSVLKVTADSKS